MFDKSPALFPIKDQYVFLSHCGISPLYSGAVHKEHELADAQSRTASLVFRRYLAVMEGLHQAAAEMLRTAPDNVSFIKNTSEGIGLIANGYPFQPGDQIISYVHEYPANHYPWKLQERRGVELVLLPDRGGTAPTPAGSPVGWSLRDLEERITPRTRVVALSHVQFTSGHVADLHALGGLCHAHNIDLVVDAAQSLGCLPVYPEDCHIDAVVSSGWKWLLGPMGSGLLYTSETFRQKLELVLVGADTMQQGLDFLNHSWNPHISAKIFEYSTVPISLAAGLECCLRELMLRYGLEAIANEIFRLQDVFLAALDRARFPLAFALEQQRSSILALIVPGSADALRRALQEENVLCTVRGGYLRIAPHFCSTDEEMVRVAELINAFR